MSLLNCVPAVTVVVLASGCMGTTYDRDLPEIGERYPYRVKDDCSSWLYSANTGFKYCASPAFVAVSPLKPVAPEIIDETLIDHASLMGRGEKVYSQTCSVCHGTDGRGTPGTFPPLAGSGEFYGDPGNHATIVLKGLSGPITVQGVAYNGAMPSQASLSDYDIASALTYERHSWGNADGDVLPEIVKALR